MSNLETIRDFIRDHIEDKPLNREWIIHLLNQAAEADNIGSLLNPKYLEASKHLSGQEVVMLTPSGAIRDQEPPIYWKV